MKLILKRVLLKRKTLLIFFIALVLPLIIVAYLGFDTLVKRHKSTKNILESNLWITSESALNQLEEELLVLEAELLHTENLQKAGINSSKVPMEDSNEKGIYESHFSLFLLSEDFDIVYPVTGTSSDEVLSPDNESDSEFALAYGQAESFEFQKRNYARATEEYQRCFELAEYEKDEAFALEGMGRTSLLQKKYSEAIKSYELLHTRYSSQMNNAGHPYGIIGLLQLQKINKLAANDTELLQDFMDSYEKLKNGYWKLSPSSYKFFCSELETILESDLRDGIENQSLQHYHSLKSTPSKYLETLEFADYLRTDLIPKMDVVQHLNDSHSDQQVHRILGNYKGKWALISYRVLTDFSDGENYIGGVKWNTDSLYEILIPALLDGISTNTGLDLFLSAEAATNPASLELPENTLSLSFRSFPIPWKLMVVQPAMFSMEKGSRKEMFIYGLMLGIVFIIMTLGAILIARDIRREAEAMHMKTEFVHNVSHELKTPLSLIRLYGETLLIKENLSASDKTDALQVITKESERLSHMINNILDFSKIEMGKKEFNFQKGNMATTILETLDSYRYHLEKEGFKIREEIDRDIPWILFDKQAIERLMINLLSNAIKYSPGKKELIIRLLQKHAYILLEVSDKGIGIASDELSHIFDRFYRSRQKLGFESRGSGLGLTLVKHIIDSHEGHIHVRSEPGKGSTFTIKLPISPSSNKDQE